MRIKCVVESRTNLQLERIPSDRPQVKLPENIGRNRFAQVLREQRAILEGDDGSREPRDLRWGGPPRDSVDACRRRRKRPMNPVFS